MPDRLKLIVGYDGRPFAGWQSQVGGNTVQDHLERAFAAVTGMQVRVHGAGRTDAGVHALAQCAHADVPGTRLPPERWTAALNASLPPTIRVLRCRPVAQNFHARFSAKGKVYRYRIWNERILAPHEIGRSWHVAVPLDLALVAAAAKEFTGTHDFRCFSANRGKPEEDTIRTIERVTVRTAGRCVTVDVSGNGFLYKMVRLMVGALVRCGHGRLPIDDLRARLRAPLECTGHARIVAPAEGLFLLRVRY